ncbi:glycosyltransferase [Isoptericola dokdonensis]|uniref:Putative teichuronic acid biosynthesis glycosyltransferase TuaH n=1 Tax=Isoptericola dokdonensis DS-3 TaxID=1300344 RepID=A0A161I9N5_9MICO|nr:glycosyltransferase [Isoptericola dokdonensis]ANC32708.1 Putative teichuronic acid biosynthesis glycosyltransferase TuaH [Isoptericola dokdonensis DS-3]
MSGTPTDLVVISLEAWDDVWRRNQHLVARLLRDRPGQRVLFVEPPADPLHSLSRRRRPRLGRGLRPGPDLPGVGQDARLWLHEPTKPLPRRVDPRADDRLAASVLRAARRLGMTDPLLWVNDPSGARMLRTTTWPALYDVTDDWAAAHRDAAEADRVRQDEELLLGRCEQVTVCSTGLVRTKGPARRDAGRPDVVLVTNAVDVERYLAPAARPADLPAGPVALYVGTVHPDRFDTDVAVATARRLTGTATLVLVGPVVDLTTARLDALREAGVVMLGPRPFDQVPAYLQHAAVLLVPHVVDPFTDSLDPIKLYEYRVVGRPVVATAVAGFRELATGRSGGAPLVVAAAPDFPAAVADLVASHRATSPDPTVPTWDDQARLMAGTLDLLRPAARR